MKRVMAAVLCISALAGCATVVNPEDLARPATQTTINLPQGYSYIGQFGGLCKPQVEYKLVAGQYVSELEDDRGTFFRGPGKALSTRMLGGKCASANVAPGLDIEAGVYVPKDQVQRAWVYFHNPPNGLIDTTVTGVMQSSGNAPVSDQIANSQAVNSAYGAAAAGAGGGLGIGISNAIVASEYGSIRDTPLQPKDNSLRAAITR